jgi:transposase-like protein
MSRQSSESRDRIVGPKLRAVAKRLRIVEMLRNGVPPANIGRANGVSEEYVKRVERRESRRARAQDTERADAHDMRETHAR